MLSRIFSRILSYGIRVTTYGSQLFSKRVLLPISLTFSEVKIQRELAQALRLFRSLLFEFRRHSGAASTALRLHDPKTTNDAHKKMTNCTQ